MFPKSKKGQDRAANVSLNSDSIKDQLHTQEKYYTVNMLIPNVAICNVTCNPRTNAAKLVNNELLVTAVGRKLVSRTC